MSPIAKGSIILVTGANGYAAGVAIGIFISRGFCVRGTVRDPTQHSWMLSHYGPKFSLVAIPDMSLPGAFDEAIKGVDAVAHIASTVRFDLDPNAVIPPIVRMAVEILDAIKREGSGRIKNVVLTSSSWACKHTGFEEPYTLTPSTWNEEAKQARAPPKSTGEFQRMALNYACAKMEAEQACFEWIRKNNPEFTFNSIVPGQISGVMTRPDITGFPSSSGHLKNLWQGNVALAKVIPPQGFVDVEDVALLHLAALTQEDVVGERIIAVSEAFSWNRILDAFRRSHPGRSFIPDIEEMFDRGTFDNVRGDELLRRLKSEGFVSLEESVIKWIPWMIEVEGSEVPEGEVDRLDRDRLT